jgi:uncharacterized protein
MRIAQIAALAALVAAAAALAGVGRPGAAHGSNTPSGRTITVTGSGTARAVPNVASFSFGVQTDGPTAQAAQAANAQRTARVIAALRRIGIAKRDLQTTDVSVGPEWNNDGSVRGYAAHSSLQATVHRVRRAGRVVDAAVAGGATETSGPTFARADRAALYKGALRNAVSQARAKAAALAAEANVRLAGVVSVAERLPEPQPQPLGDAAYAASLQRTPVEPGTQETQATVSVTFALA